MKALAVIIAVTAIIVPTLASAQAYRCALPAELPRPRPDGPTQSQPRRDIPIGSYTLAISWQPQLCRNAGPDDRLACGNGNRFGFTLHGLWPDGKGRDWPQYCRPAALLPERVIRANLCMTPSVQLLQHEYAKHGTCMGIPPTRYFADASRLYSAMRYPDMAALSRRRQLTTGQFAAAFARANPGLTPRMIKIAVTRDGWLDEVRVCMDMRYRYRICPSRAGAAADSARLKIWRGPR